MGMLEVHDGRGRVNFVAITPAKPLLFGTDATCDIVLHGDGIVAIHGRLRWKETKYKVEATPEAKFVEVNGRKAVSASFRLGDEIRIGPAVIYLTESEEAAQAAGSPAKPRAAAPRQPAPAPSTAPRDRAGAPELAAPPREAPATFDDRDASRSRTAAAAPPPAVAARPAGKQPGRIRRFFKELLTSESAPGQEKIATSPVVVLLVCVLVLFSALSFSLYRVIHRSQVESQYNSAMKAFEDADYRNAIADFDVFIKGNPEDLRVRKAKVLQAAAKVRQYGTGPNPNWANTINEAQAMVKEVGKFPEYRDESVYLAELVLKAAEGLADRAKSSTDPKVLAEAEAAGKLHLQIAGKAGRDYQGRSRYPEKVAVARAAVDKAKAKADAVAAMEKAMKDKSAAGVYEARDGLILSYPDLAKDPLVVKRLTTANDLLRQSVKLDDAKHPAETAPRHEPLGPPTSLVLRLNPGAGAARPGAGTPVVYALAQGIAFGLDGLTGKPLWQFPVGLSCPFPPVPLRGDDPSAVAVDARHQELVRIDGRTGKLLWRLGLGERIMSPPLVAGNQLVLPTPSGRLLLINVLNGELQGSLNLGRALGVTPVADENGQYFYVLADSAVLYVISREQKACVAVEYLGHTAGSIPCPPVRIGRYLIVPENYAKDAGRWVVLVLEDEGKHARLAQQVPLPGWTWDTPAASQSVIWATGDRAGIAAYAIGPYTQADPIKRIAGLTAEAESSGPAFARTKGERELWLSSGLSGRYDLDPDKGAIKAAWTLREAGPALAPIQLTEKLAVLTHQYPDGPGVALWAVNPADGKVAWRTVLGVPWPVEPAPAADGQGLVTLAASGKPAPLTKAQLARGGFLEQALPKPGDFALPTGPLRRLEAAGVTVLVPGGDASYLLVREGAGDFRRIDLPAPLDAPPMFLGADLVIPASGGRAFLIDPKTGGPRAEPYLAVFDKANPARWKAPVRLGDDAVLLADESGKLRRLTRKEAGAEGGGPRLVATDEAGLGTPLAADPAAVGEAVLLVTTDKKVHARSARDLSPMGKTDLTAPLALGPVAAGDLVYVADAAGTILAFGPDGLKRWQVNLGGAPPVGPPILRGESALFVDRDGVLHRLALADGVPQAEAVPLDVLPSGPPQAAGDDIYLPVAPGSIRLLDAKATEVAKP